MKFIYSYVKQYNKMILTVLSIKLLGTFGELLIPYVLEYMIDDVVPQKMLWKVIFWGVIMVGLAGKSYGGQSIKTQYLPDSKRFVLEVY